MEVNKDSDEVDSDVSGPALGTEKIQIIGSKFRKEDDNIFSPNDEAF